MRKLLIALTICCSCAKSDPTPPASITVTPVDDSPLAKNFAKDGYQRVWADEFDGTTLDLTKWEYRGLGTVRNLGRVAKETVSLDGKGKPEH